MKKISTRAIEGSRFSNRTSSRLVWIWRSNKPLLHLERAGSILEQELATTPKDLSSVQ